MKNHPSADTHEKRVIMNHPRRYSTHTILLATLFLYATQGLASTCTVLIPDYGGHQKWSGECLMDETTNTTVIYDGEYWENFGRKILVPRAKDGSTPASYVSIQPSSGWWGRPPHEMSYLIVVQTRKGLYRFKGETPIEANRSGSPPSLWQLQKPNEAMDHANKMSMEKMLLELQKLQPIGPALDLRQLKQVISQTQSMADRLPMLAGTSMAPSANAHAGALQSVSTRPEALPPSTPPQRTLNNGSLSAQECAAKKQQVITTQIPPDASITASLETVMFMARAVIDMIHAGCPPEQGTTGAQITAELKLRQEQYAEALNACNAAQSGGRQCIAKNHFSSTGTPQKPMVAPKDCDDLESDALDKVRKHGSGYADPDRYIAARVKIHKGNSGMCEHAKRMAEHTFKRVDRNRQEYESLKNDAYQKKTLAYKENLALKAKAIDSALVESAVAKMEICLACGRAAVPDDIPQPASTGKKPPRDVPSSPTSDWETSPGVRR